MSRAALLPHLRLSAPNFADKSRTDRRIGLWRRGSLVNPSSGAEFRAPHQKSPPDHRSGRVAARINLYPTATASSSFCAAAHWPAPARPAGPRTPRKRLDERPTERGLTTRCRSRGLSEHATYATASCSACTTVHLLRLFPARSGIAITTECFPVCAHPTQKSC
jgi:hypothetical protein